MLRDIDAEMATYRERLRELASIRQFVVNWKTKSSHDNWAELMVPPSEPKSENPSPSPAAPAPTATPVDLVAPIAANTPIDGDVDAGVLILAALREAPSGLTAKELLHRMVAAGWITSAKDPEKVVRAKLAKLLNRGLLTRIAPGRYALPSHSPVS
jgi:hypothetical protein